MPDTLKSDSDSPVLNSPVFMNCRSSRESTVADIDVVISGIPYDQSSTGRPGAGLGPAAIRKASSHLAWELRRWPWDFSVFDVIGVVDDGDLNLQTSDRNQILSLIQRHASDILKAGSAMLTFGGDHYISLPILRAFCNKFGPVAVIHFDAHTDTEREPDLQTHGTMFFERFF